MVRRPVAAVAAVVLFGEAVGIALLNWILGLMVDRQQMSMGGMDPDAMSLGTWIMGGVFGFYLLCCAVVLLRAALRDRAPGRFARILLVSCAVLHGLLGALTVGLVGWLAFGFMMVVLGLIVLTLMGYEDGAGAAPGDSGEQGELADGAAASGGPEAGLA
ncbi:hypothetical protein ACZ90_34080 [Streptomyces albus subsp. albus]|nr:hypothetical protein ACZ90_34080 [Streptomyces albus subsp. albus]